MIINIVRESLNFNRIGSPIKKMEIGQEDNKKFIEETDWYTIRSFRNPDFFKRAKPIDLIRNYKGFPILVYEIDNKRTTKILLYMATSTIDETSAYETKEEAIKYMKKRISNYIRRTGLSERLEFNREGSPIEKIDIGQKEIDRQIIENTEWNWDIDSVPPLFPNVKKN
jgi:hypothetical protein